MTHKLYLALVLDAWPSSATCIDFGIDTDSHLGALRYAILDDGVTEEQLDAALGKGPEIQKLISETNPYRFVVFKTAYDHLLQTMDYEHPRWPEFAEKLRKVMNGEVFSTEDKGHMTKLADVLAEMGMNVESSLVVLGEYRDELDYLITEEDAGE